MFRTLRCDLTRSLAGNPYSRSPSRCSILPVPVVAPSPRPYSQVLPRKPVRVTLMIMTIHDGFLHRKIRNTTPNIYNTLSGVSLREAPFRSIDLGDVALRSLPT